MCARGDWTGKHIPQSTVKKTSEQTLKITSQWHSYHDLVEMLKHVNLLRIVLHIDYPMHYMEQKPTDLRPIVSPIKMTKLKCSLCVNSQEISVTADVDKKTRNGWM